MRFGQDIGEQRFDALVRRAHAAGLTTFVTADVYGDGQADSALGRALAESPRQSYRLVGAVGHDFYAGRRVRGVYPRFTDPDLRPPQRFGEYLRMTVEKSLERLGTDHLDVLLLHNPDAIGYTHEAVWSALAAIRDAGLTGQLGVAPGPANGYVLDVIGCMERYAELTDWAMLILNPMEGWPGRLVLPAAEHFNVGVLARVVDYGGLFLGGLRPGERLARGDHRGFRPGGWIEAAAPKMDQFRVWAESAGLSLLQFACRWTLAQPAVRGVVPTLIQESGESARPIEALLDELAALPNCPVLAPEIVEQATRLGDNAGTMPLKGGSPQYLGRPTADQWPLTPELADTARRWSVVPDRDLYCPDDPRDIRETGAAVDGVVQTSTRRLFVQLHAFTDGRDLDRLADALAERTRPGGSLPFDYVLYRDLNDPRGSAVLVLAEQPETLAAAVRDVLGGEPFAELTPRPELTMLGRTYSSGREEDLADWLLDRPRRTALDPDCPWAVWYPLRRTGEFALLSADEQAAVLSEHARTGRTYGQAGYAHDVRLACHGLDRDDNEFVIGLVGPELYPLSRLVQEMRRTRQTARYIRSLGPFFVGFAHARSAYRPPPR